MNYTLTLRQDSLLDEEGGRHTVYGINIADDQGALLAFPDISFDKATVEKLMAVCKREQVELCHIKDIIENVIVEQYL